MTAAVAELLREMPFPGSFQPADPEGAAVLGAATAVPRGTELPAATAVPIGIEGLAPPD
jgi:hypothetical protein